MRPLNALAERQVAEVLRGAESEPGPAELALIVAGAFWLAGLIAWARYWRLV